MDMIDPVILETCSDHEQALRCIHIGFLCTQAKASFRPSMSTISLMLSSKLVELPDPAQPAVVSSGVNHHINSASNSGDSYTSATISNASSITSSYTLVPPSNATASITDLVPR